MGSSPAFQMYTGEWLKTASLSMCEPATRGIWIDLCCAIWDADNKGSISGTVKQLARVARCLPSELEAALKEFEANDVADLEQDGDVWTITSRRMKKQLAEMHGNRERVRKHRKKKRGGNGDVTADVMPEKRAGTEEGRLKGEEGRMQVRGESGERGDPLSTFISITGYEPHFYHADKISQLVHDHDRWEALCYRWMDSEYKPQNVDGLLALYQKTKTDGQDQKPLTRSQYAGLPIQEKLERGGYRIEDFINGSTSDTGRSGEGGRALGAPAKRTDGAGA